ncbi:MAG: CheY-P-specific phosphatase CheC [Firmicutes bacterium]|nr:CheY-P-specific phosphatase CheC [Bacillota bacterium]
MDGIKRLSFIQQDLLKELGTIGTGNAATAMAELIGTKITITVPTVEILPFARVTDFVGGPDKILGCVYLDVHGSLPGTVLILFEKAAAEGLLKQIMFGAEVNLLEMNEMEQSALKEIGNILSGSYLSALADFTGHKMISSVPNLAVDMAAAVLSVPMSKLGRSADYALLIQAAFFENQTSNGCVVFIPQPDSTEKLLRIFGVREYD